MNRPANIKFLTERENQCLELLLQAQDIFDDICAESPQSPTDSFNFGHYLDAARSSVLLRGARRLDPDNLLVRKNPHSPSIPPDVSIATFSGIGHPTSPAAPGRYYTAAAAAYSAAAVNTPYPPNDESGVNQTTPTGSGTPNVKIESHEEQHIYDHAAEDLFRCIDEQFGTESDEEGR